MGSTSDWSEPNRQMRLTTTRARAVASQARCTGQLIVRRLESANEPSPLDGTALDGTALDGTALDGTALDGTALEKPEVERTVGEARRSRAPQRWQVGGPLCDASDNDCR